jgi:hypothetical protein
MEHAVMERAPAWQRDMPAVTAVAVQRDMPTVTAVSVQRASGWAWWRGRSAQRRMNVSETTVWHRQQVARQRAEMRVFQAGLARMVR